MCSSSCGIYSFISIYFLILFSLFASHLLRSQYLPFVNDWMTLQLEALECVLLVVKRERMVVYLRISYGLYLEDRPKRWVYNKAIRYIISCIKLLIFSVRKSLVICVYDVIIYFIYVLFFCCC